MRINKITVLLIILVVLVSIIILLPKQRKRTELPLPESAAPQEVNPEILRQVEPLPDTNNLNDSAN